MTFDLLETDLEDNKLLILDFLLITEFAISEKDFPNIPILEKKPLALSNVLNIVQYVYKLVWIACYIIKDMVKFKKNRRIIGGKYYANVLQKMWTNMDERF